jgi:CRISPR-associated endonuclease/helicase Cas3
VHIVTVPEGEENLDSLPAIRDGKRAFFRLMHEGNSLLPTPGADLNQPDLIRQYFAYYFYEQAENMNYSICDGNSGRKESLLRLLGRNDRNPGFKPGVKLLQQPFAAAAALFRPIDAPTQGVLVPYERGRDIIAELASTSGLYKKKDLLREAQRYTVNVYPNMLDKLCRNNAITVLSATGLLCLNEEWYSADAGVCAEPVGETAANLC